MTRIISGTYGGKRLSVPPRGTRPTSDRVREALFSSLDTTGLLPGARVLDLCAGSGALAFEALSRGARYADLVESHGPTARIARANARSLGIPAGRVQVHVRDIRAFLASEITAYDVILCDPPYRDAQQLIGAALELVAREQLLVPDGLFVAESRARDELAFPAPWRTWQERRYGDTAVTLLELPATAGAVDAGEPSAY